MMRPSASVGCIFHIYEQMSTERERAEDGSTILEGLDSDNLRNKFYNQ